MTDPRDTDVVILCGGKGTRLREETRLRPKPMVPIGPEPILWHIMKIYAGHGFRRFVLALGYRGDYIRRYFRRTPVPAWDVVLADTGEETLKGGRLKRVEKFLRSPVFHLTYGDGVADVDVRRLHRYHAAHGRWGTVTAVRPPSRFGELSLRGNAVTSFEEKPQMGTGYINGGFFVFQRRFLSLLSPSQNCDLEFGAMQNVARRGQLRAYKHHGFWQCMDNARERDLLNELWAKRRAPWRNW